MRKIALVLVLILAVASVSFAAVKKAAPKETVSDVSKSKMTISPKISYVGYLGIGAEFSPLYQITKDIDLMGEVNWDFWGWSGGSGYIYGELNAVYKAQPFNMGQGQVPLNPYVGGGLIYGFPMGSAWYGGNYSGGIGIALFGGVTGKMDPYTWFAQLKYASAPITLKYNLGAPVSESVNALGVGMEWGVRLPL